MRMLRDSCVGGFAPKPPGFCRLSRQNRLCCFAIGGYAPKPRRDAADRRRVHRLLAIPAAESALGLRPRIALSSAQVIPEWTTSTLPCNDFSADGNYPLTPCLTPGVHFKDTSPSLAPLKKKGAIRVVRFGHSLFREHAPPQSGEGSLLRWFWSFADASGALAAELALPLWWPGFSV